MKSIYPILLILFFACHEVNKKSDDCYYQAKLLGLSRDISFKNDTILIKYQPFEIRSRAAYSVYDLDKYNYTDTIVSPLVIETIDSLYKSVITSETIQSEPISSFFFPKMICDFYSNGRRTKRIYFDSVKRLNANGLVYENDRGLVFLFLNEMKSDDRFREKYKQYLGD
ncbi:hypothetical protein [Algivirga pacifica]|uniref:DUF4136 domain-containing protein n=1 Tax=Algivirga pacifica TaxID=1162670 RepID=A0ABP9DIM9_9BACT